MSGFRSERPSHYAARAKILKALITLSTAINDPESKVPNNFERRLLQDNDYEHLDERAVNIPIKEPRTCPGLKVLSIG